MTERLFEIERVNSQTARKVYADEDGNVIEQTIFDPNPTLKDAEFFRDQDVNKRAPGRLVALLPLEVIEQWKREKGIDWFTATEAQKAALLNDPDNSLFRTGGGHI
jgi:hypothetical protein